MKLEDISNLENLSSKEFSSSSWGDTESRPNKWTPESEELCL